MHYEALIEQTERKGRRKRTRERKLFVRGADITEVLNVVGKIRGAKLIETREISKNQYIAGVSDNNY